MKNKKYLGMLGLGCAAFLLTGCGGSSNKLTCTATQEMGGLAVMDVEATLTFDEDWKKITEMELTQTVKVTSDEVTDEMIDSLMTSVEEQCEEDKENVTKCDVKRDGKKIIATMVGTPDGEGNGLKEEMTKEEALEALEAQGYTCK